MAKNSPNLHRMGLVEFRNLELNDPTKYEALLNGISAALMKHNKELVIEKKYCIRGSVTSYVREIQGLYVKGPFRKKSKEQIKQYRDYERECKVNGSEPDDPEVFFSDPSSKQAKLDFDTASEVTEPKLEPLSKITKVQHHVRVETIDKVEMVSLPANLTPIVAILIDEMNSGNTGELLIKFKANKIKAYNFHIAGED